MKTTGRIVVVAALVAAVVLVLAFKRSGGTADVTPTGQSVPPGASQEMRGLQAAAAVPRLVDLGASTCIPCKMMVPVLEELKAEYAGRLRVEFVDVRENPRAAADYGIQVIPTQIFYDASGKELFRHEGFISKEDILAKWKELGIDLSASAQ
jgi:thioredoxin 1